jgi:hypothetical protein
LNCESCAVTGRRGRETGPTHPSNWSVCPPASCTLSQVQVSALDQSRSESTVDVMVQHDRTERRSPGPGLGNLGGNYRHDGAILGEQGRCWAEWDWQRLVPGARIDPRVRPMLVLEGKTRRWSLRLASRAPCATCQATLRENFHDSLSSNFSLFVALGF